MTADEPIRVIIRSRFWPRFLRWAVGLQLGLVLPLGLGLVSRGLQGVEQMAPREFGVLAVSSASLAVVAAAIAIRRRNVGAAEINPSGIRPFTDRGRRPPWHHWEELDSVLVRSGLVGNRWLVVCPFGKSSFVLTARPIDPTSVLDALERFAGPDHPLTLAMAEVVDL